MVSVRKSPTDFDEWNRRKQVLNFSEPAPTLYFKEGEIWWCSLGVNVGVETDGKNDNFERPVLILKKFNRHMVWVLPVTTGFKKTNFHYHINYAGQDRWVILSQLKTISTKRLLRRIETLPQDDFQQIKTRVSGLVNP